ncbi:hypothetical protein Aph01nite_39860 [Acrocarpospora phusangensis]|uniref:DUF4331 domain-containing protein n=2 Tax=Acrocarpospora phusangensis TaxID=1070424 RepID=A0A919QBB4_9ACTN|nr:hypothetical protein Aph01nite_39860 [Acrocarpospora phusangensis]
MLAAGFLAGPGTLPGQASNHLAAPTQILDPRTDVTDLYAFTSPDRPDTVTVIWNHLPFELPDTPLPWYRFATQGFYDLHFDNTGDGRPELTYRWRYHDGRPDLREQPPQSYRLEVLQPGRGLEVLLADAPVGPYPVEDPVEDTVGAGFAVEWKRAVVPLPGGGQTFSGQVRDPYAEFRVLAGGTPFNVHSIAVQLPKTELALNGDVGRNPVVGIWATSSRRSLDLRDAAARPYRQVSREGSAMFGDGLLPQPLRDAYQNVSSPHTDHAWAELRAAVHHPLVSRTLATGLPPKEPRIDLEQVFLTGIAEATGPIRIDLNAHLLNRDADPARIVPAEMTRLNMTTPVTARPDPYGLAGGDPQGWPNGRRLTDNVTVAFTRLARGEPVGGGAPPAAWLSPAKGVTGFPYEAAPELRRQP